MVYGIESLINMSYVNKYGLKCGTSMGFGGNNEWINSIDPYD